MIRAACVALAVGLLLGPAGSAGASESSTSSTHDGTHDVVLTSTGAAQLYDVPGADITRLRAAYRHQLEVSVRLRELAATVTVGFRIRAAGETYRLLVRSRHFGVASVRLLDGSGPVDCPHLVGGLGPGLTLNASVPAGCLGDASSVRVGALATVPAGSERYVDDALRAAFDPSRGLRKAKLGPAIGG